MKQSGNKPLKTSFEEMSGLKSVRQKILLVCPPTEEIAQRDQTEDGLYDLVWKPDVHTALETLCDERCVGVYLSRACIAQLNDLNDSIIHDQILDSLSSGVAVLDLQKRVRWCNRQFLDCCVERDARSVLNRNFYHVLGNPECLKALAPLDETIATGACSHAVLQVSFDANLQSEYADDAESAGASVKSVKSAPSKSAPFSRNSLDCSSDRSLTGSSRLDGAEEQEWEIERPTNTGSLGFAFDALLKGRGQDEPLNQSDDSRFSPETNPRVKLPTASFAPFSGTKQGGPASGSESRIAASEKKALDEVVRESGKRFYLMHVSPLLETPWEPESSSFQQLLVVLTDISEDEIRKRRQEEIHRAGAQLVDLSPQELLDMSIKERMAMLKSNILTVSRQLMNFDNLEIRLVEEQSAVLVLFMTQGMAPDSPMQPLKIAMDGGGISGIVAQTGDYYLCPDTQRDPEYLTGLEGARSSLTVPIRFHGKTIGTFNVERREPDAFSFDDVNDLQILADNVGLALNTFRLLVTEKSDAAVNSVDRVHKEIALPVDEIINETIGALDQLGTVFLSDEMAIPSVAVLPSDSQTESDQQTQRIIPSEIRNALKRIADSAAGIKQILRSEREKLQDENPMTEEASSAVIASVFNKVNREESKPLEGLRILFVDESPDFRVAANDVLFRLGALTETARSGEEALAMLAKFSYDVMIFDIRLPNMSGIDFIRKIKPLGYLNKLGLVLMTGFGYDPSHTIPKARAEGITCVLYKPFRIDQITNRILESLKELESRKVKTE